MASTDEKGLRSALARAGVLVALAAVMLLFLTAADALGQSFADVNPADWYYEAVEALAAEGVVGGDPAGDFRPYDPATRGQFASMLAGVLELAPLPDTPFVDVPADYWYAGAVGALYQAGIVKGGSNGHFLPDSELARQQAATLLMRAFVYRSGLEQGQEWDCLDDAGVERWLQGFSDRLFIAPDHRAAVADTYRLGVVSGFSDSRFYPFLSLTRAQAAGILYEALMVPISIRPEPPAPLEAETSYPAARSGSRGPLVLWMERRLASLSYLPGAVDGSYDKNTIEAVTAFQKVEGLERTGVATTSLWIRLVSAQAPQARGGLTGRAVEIDLGRQVLLMTVDGVVQMTVPMASGRAGWRTPTGAFAVQRKLPYWRESYLGMLYKPAYFYGGYAIHGSHSVPAYPASHGCVRVSVSTMDVLYPLLAVGTKVYVYY